MRTVLVTGGAGFIGSHLVAALVARGDRVRVLDDFSTGRIENLAGLLDRIELIRGTLLDPAVVVTAMRGAECVFHEAALASVPASVENPLVSHAACATGTLIVLDAARRLRVRRVVFAASSAAYGNQPAPVKRETDLPEALSPYAAAKLACEYYCAAFYHTYGLETVALRYFNVFGPRQDPAGPYAAVIPIFIQRMLAGQPPRILGDGLQTRDFCYVGNVVDANLRAADAPNAAGRTINVGSGAAIDLRTLVTHLNAALGTRLEPEFAPPRAGDVRDSRADITLARELLGYEPAIDLRAGIEQTVEFFRRGAT